jgi:hypothetical protein
MINDENDFLMPEWKFFRDCCILIESNDVRGKESIFFNVKVFAIKC